MRVNVYAEEITERIDIISKTIDGVEFTGLRFYLELPVTEDGVEHRGPFLHRPGDDDSSAVTFWGKRNLRRVLRRALDKLDDHYDGLVNNANEADDQAITEAKTRKIQRQIARFEGRQPA